MVEFPGISLDLGSFEKTSAPDPHTLYDVLILGGGPAAISAAVYTIRKMMKTAVFAKEIGGQVGSTSEIENYLGFQTVTGRELVEKFKQQVGQFDIPLLAGDKVVKVEKKGEEFAVVLENGGTYRGRTVIVATGKRSRALNVPGEKEFMGKGVAVCATCDAPFFKNKKVVVAGGGNSAFTAAFDLLKVNAKTTIVNFAPGWQADEIMIESVKKFGDRIVLMDNHRITKIEGGKKVKAVAVEHRETGEQKSIAADGVFVEIGLIPNSEAVDGLVGVNRDKEIIVDCHCRTDVEGLFGAGDVTTVPFKQIVISAGEGAKAALSAYDFLVKKGLL